MSETAAKMHDPATCRNGDHYGQCSGVTLPLIAATAADPWIVHHRDGWCALPAGAEPDPQALNDPTLCGWVVNLRGGSTRGQPDCPECLELLAEEASGD